MSPAALAQTTPTLGEKKVGGTPCTNSSSATDFDTIAQCNSTSATAGTYQKAPLFVGAVTSPPYASTACDATKAGLLQYTASAFQICDGSSWKLLGSSSGGCSSSHGSQLFTASGTFTPPSTVTNSCPLILRVVVIGGGAGAGNCADSGVGSGYVAANVVVLYSAAAVTVTVGAGGGAGGANGGTTSFGSLLSASGGHTESGLTAGSGGSGGGSSASNGTGGSGGTNGSSGGSANNGTVGAGQGYPIVSSATTIGGISFSTATFAAGAGGTGGCCVYGGGGGGGGILINGTGPSGASGTSGAGGGTGYGGGGGVSYYCGSIGGAGAKGAVYVEY